MQQHAYVRESSMLVSMVLAMAGRLLSWQADCCLLSCHAHATATLMPPPRASMTRHPPLSLASLFITSLLYISYISLSIISIIVQPHEQDRPDRARTPAGTYTITHAYIHLNLHIYIHTYLNTYLLTYILK